MRVLEIYFLLTACIFFHVHSYSDTTLKLIALRSIMEVDALLITSQDAHQSEFVADEDNRLGYISHFTGSNGVAIVTKTKAALWTDMRYHEQAARELDENWIVMKEGNVGVPSIHEWLNDEFPTGALIGTDSEVIPQSFWSSLERRLQKVNPNLTLVAMEGNLIDKIWIDRYHSIKAGFVLDKEFSGMEWCEKVDIIRVELQKMGVDGMVVTALDEVAWLLNVRGYEIPQSMLFKAYVIINRNDTTIYVNPENVQGNILDYFSQCVSCITAYISFSNYEDIWTDLPKYNYIVRRFLVPSARSFSLGASKRIFSLVNEKIRVFEPSPIIEIKAVKNPTEILGMEKANIRDSVALCRFLSYLEESIRTTYWDERKVTEVLQKFRGLEMFFLGLSFDTVAGFGPNSALPHHQPDRFDFLQIFDNGTLLLDSGGQYLDGTTDVTRTLHFGKPTLIQKEMYTRVLMGVLQFSYATFPSGVNTAIVDAYARSALWEIGCDYRHGSGHGIGMANVVHESPIHINWLVKTPTALKPGHFLTIEPGYYEENNFGIRLENVLEVVEKPYRSANGKPFLGFKTITLVPFQKSLIDFRILTYQHIRWLEEYNAQVKAVIGPELIKRKDFATYHWLQENTKYT